MSATGIFPVPVNFIRGTLISVPSEPIQDQEPESGSSPITNQNPKNAHLEVENRLSLPFCAWLSFMIHPHVFLNTGIGCEPGWGMS
jgi:hypothetical protein